MGQSTMIAKGAADLQAASELPDKLEKRSEYLKGKGYDVRVRVVYTRLRRVRALDEEQAREFAIIREARYAPRYFASQNQCDCVINSVEALEAKHNPGPLDKARMMLKDDKPVSFTADDGAGDFTEVIEE